MKKFKVMLPECIKEIEANSEEEALSLFIDKIFAMLQDNDKPVIDKFGLIAWEIGE